jgi:uncharacterized membrane protein
MTKLNFRQTGPICLAFAILTLTSSVAFAAPQDDIFSRSSDKKAETSKEAETSQATETKTNSAASSSIVKESTAKIDQQSDGWFTVVDDDAMVEYRLPSKPTYKEITFSPIKGRTARVNRIHGSLSSDKQIDVAFSWWDLHEAPEKSRLKDTLEGAVKGSVLNVFGELTRMDNISSGRVPGRDFDFKFVINPPDGKTYEMSGKSRIFIKGNRRFQMQVISYAGKENEELTNKFFDSLIIKSK